MSVRLVILTGTCAVGKSTFAPKLVFRLARATRLFHLDYYIPAPPPPGYAKPWPLRRPGYLSRIGHRVAEALKDSSIAVFEGVLVGPTEVPTLARSAGLSGPEVFTVIIRRPLEACWARKSREPGFKEREGVVTVADFARKFYEPYQPRGVMADLELTGDEVDGDVGVERVLRSIEARG